MATPCVQVATNQFLSIRSQNLPIPSSLADKYEHLKATFDCFKDGPGATHEKEKWTNVSHKHNGKPYTNRSGPSRTDKVRIGNRDLSRENLARKDFLALMNKLSEQNCNNILRSIKNVLREDCISTYADITWDMMQRCPDIHPLHVKVVHLIKEIVTQPQQWEHEWHRIWTDYVQKQAWSPPPTLLEEQDYDEFCDFVKWKKRAIASVKAWVLLEKEGFVTGASDLLIEKLLRVDDVSLDQLITLARSAPGVYTKIRGWLEEQLEGAKDVKPYTRFKLYDLQELLNQG
jgi:hypothetical protein